jgi:DNA topoisomerase-1
VLATIVRLLETTFIRVGNKEYTKQNDSYGLTTLRNRHVSVRGSQVQFYFRGKSGVKHTIDIQNALLAKIVRRLRDLPGYELFQYYDESGKLRAVGSADVNQYVREATGEDFTAKDFRTWAGTILAAEALEGSAAASTTKQTPEERQSCHRRCRGSSREYGRGLSQVLHSPNHPGCLRRRIVPWQVIPWNLAWA